MSDAAAETRERPTRWASFRGAKASLNGPWLAVLVSLLAFGARVYRLGSQSLWADEAKSVVVSSWPLLSIFAEQVGHEHPPLHYLLLHFLMPLAGRSEFVVRYVSLFFGVLLVPLLYVVGKRLAGERVGILAALVAALSPFYVRFAQETRMYTLSFFLSLLSTYLFLRIVLASEKAQPVERGLSLGWVVATAAALYSHYFTLFIIVAQVIYIPVSWLRYRAPLKPWLWRLLGVGLLFLPWALLMVQGLLRVDPALRTSGQAAGPNSPVAGGILSTLLEGRAGMVSLPSILRQALISFGPSDFAGLGATPWLALGFVLVAVVGLWKYPKPAWRWKLWLLLAFCLPLILGFVVGFPANRPLWIKYFGVASPAFYLLVALGLAVLVSGRYRKVVGVVLLAGVIGLSILSLRNYHTEAQYSRYDLRPHIESLEASALPRDALLINPWTHFPTFWYYYRAGHPEAEFEPDVYYPLEWTDSEKELEAISGRHSGVWVIKNMPNDLDADGAIESWLARHAFPTTTIWADHVRIRHYSLPEPAAAEQAGAVSYGASAPVFNSQIALHGYHIVPQTREHRQDLQMTLFWQALAAPNSSYWVTAQLVDEQGRTWGQSDSPPLAGFYPTRDWTAGEEVEDHLGLQALPGTPAGTYWVKMGLYRADDGQRLPVSWPGGVPDPGDGPAPEADSLWLGPIELASTSMDPLPVEGQNPLSTAPAASHPLDVNLGGKARLLGYDLTNDRRAGGKTEEGTIEAKPGDSLRLTLYWQTLASMDVSYTVFTHLLDGTNAIWGQHDSVPGGGSWPTTGWAVDQVIEDPYVLTVGPDAPDGKYAIEVGMYDAATGQRLAVLPAEGEGTGDRVLLPVTVVVQ